ncbi:ribose-phosphate pyrophosphokinase 5 [Physcia stellaris]|nr:ribose-phosphate pyrophosphokinase 5 [Physcia stellaris]
MAELGLVASIVGIADVGVKISSGLYKLAVALKQAGKDVRSIANHLNSISSVLRHFAEVIRSKADLLDPARALAEDLISSCEDRLVESQEMLDRLEPLVEQTGTRTDRAMLRVRWVLEKTKFATHQESLASLQGTLTLLISTMTYEHAAARNTSSMSDREQVENCVREVLLDVQSAEVTVQGTVRQMASTSGTSNLASLTTAQKNNDGNRLEDDYEKEIDRDDVIAEDDVRSGSGVNTTRFRVSSVVRHGGSLSASQVVPYIPEPVADSDPEIEDMSRALVPFFEIRFLQKRTLRFTREILGRHPHGGTPARHRSEEGSEQSPSLSQGSGRAKQRESLHPEQHAQSRQSVDEYMQQTPNSGPEQREYRQDQSSRAEESIPPRWSSGEDSGRSPYLSHADHEQQSSSTVHPNYVTREPSPGYLQQMPHSVPDPREYRQDQSFRPRKSIFSTLSSDENSRHSLYLSQANHERQSSSTVPSNLRVPEAPSEHLESLPSIARDSPSPLGFVSDLRSSTLDSSSQSFLLKDLKGRTHEINFDKPEIRNLQDFFCLLITLNMLDPEKLFERPLNGFKNGFFSRSQKINRGPAKRTISRNASGETADKIKVYSAIDALNHARAKAIDKGEFIFLGPEGRVIQPPDWQKAIKPDSVVEIAFNDPQLETENLKQVDDAYINPQLKINVLDRRP